jgi:hypothetical protein
MALIATVINFALQLQPLDRPGQRSRILDYWPAETGHAFRSVMRLSAYPDQRLRCLCVYLFCKYRFDLDANSI